MGYGTGGLSSGRHTMLDWQTRASLEVCNGTAWVVSPGLNILGSVKGVGP